MAVNNWKSGGVDHNWNTTGNWSLGAVPTASDTNTATIPSGTGWAMTVNVAAVCQHLDLSAADIAVTWTNSITVSGNVTGPSSTLTGSGTGGLVSVTTGTWTGGSTVFTQPVTLSGTITFTTSGTWKNSGLVTVGASTLTTTLTGGSWTISGGGLHVGGTTSTVGGSTIFTLTGGTWDSAQTGAGAFISSVTFNGSCTFSGTVRYKTGTITWTSGTITVASSTLQIQASCTLTTNGMNWQDINITISGTSVTLGSALQLVGTMTHSLGGGSFIGAYAITTGAWTLSGGTTLTTTLSGTVTCSGLLTMSNSAGTTLVGGFLITADSCNISNTQTVTLASPGVQIVGNTTIADATTINGTGFDWKTGGLTMTGTLAGNASLTFNGTGTWSGAAVLSMFYGLTINTAGTLTLSGTLNTTLGTTGTLLYTAGTVSAGTSILTIGGTTTLDTGGMTWANVTFTAVATITLNSTLNVSDTLALQNTSVNFTGAAGFTVGTLDNTAIASTSKILTLQHGITYRVGTLMGSSGTSAALVLTITSEHASLTAALIVGPGASQDVGYVTATRIDSSGGRTIFDYKGTLTGCVNWTTTAQPLTFAAIGGDIIRGAWAT